MVQIKSAKNLLVYASMFRGTSSPGSSLCASSRATSRSLKTAAPRTLWCYARALYHDDSATLDDLREAVTTLEETERTARRVLGRAHPIVVAMEQSLRNARAALRAREGDDISPIREAVEAMAMRK